MQVGDVIINPNVSEIWGDIVDPLHMMMVVQIQKRKTIAVTYIGGVIELDTSDCEQWEVSHHVDIERIIFGLENKPDNFVAQSCEQSTVNHPLFSRLLRWMKMSNKLKLKPCPKCGTVPRIKLLYGRNNTSCHFIYSVVCQNCGYSVGFSATKENAVKVWNDMKAEEVSDENAR